MLKLKMFIIAIFVLEVSSGCSIITTRKALREVEHLLDSSPYEALVVLSQIDSSSLWFKPLRVRHSLYSSIAMDNIHINNGRYVNKMEEANSWYRRFGNFTHRISAKYYFGDQLYDSGNLAEAAVQMMIVEQEARLKKKWIYAGNAARSLYTIFSITGNYADEIASLERSINYYQQAEKDDNEVGVMIKLGKALFDNSEYKKSDSLYSLAIQQSLQKQNMQSLTNALSRSTDVLLAMSPPQSEKVLHRLEWAEKLGYTLDCRSLANKAYALYLAGYKEESDDCLKEAYSGITNESDKIFVQNKDLIIRDSAGDLIQAYSLLSSLYQYSDTVSIRRMRHSVEKAQGLYLMSSNERLEREKRIGWTIAFLVIVLIVLLLIIASIIYKKKKQERTIEEEERQMKFDQYSFAYEELSKLGLESLDKISKAYDAPESMKAKYLLTAFEQVAKRFRSDMVFQDRFIDNVDKAHDGVITKLKSQVPDLSHNQILLYAYLAQDFSYTTISVLMAKNRQNIYDRRWNLVKSISEANSQDKGLLLSFIPNRPTRVKNDF